MSTLLFADEDPAQHAAHVRLLSADGHQVIACNRDRCAPPWVRQQNPELVLFSWCADGAPLCRQLHEQTTAPIVVLTAPCAQAQRELIMHSGAERYVIEPCAPRELSAHVRNALRHAALEPAPRLLRAGDLVLDVNAHRALRNGRLIALTHKEFLLLTELVRHQGVLLTREMLLQRIWDDKHSQHSRTLDVHIGWLRKKIEDNPDRPRRIRTVPTQGYCFEG